MLFENVICQLGRISRSHDTFSRLSRPFPVSHAGVEINGSPIFFKSGSPTSYWILIEEFIREFQ